MVTDNVFLLKKSHFGAISEHGWHVYERRKCLLCQKI